MKRVSMMDVARAAGVSKNAVSLALRNDPQIPERTRRRIREVADGLGYVANAVVSELMTELRRGGSAGYLRTLALLNANQDEGAFERHPTVPHYVAGCRRRAGQLGYGLDEFWLHDPGLSCRRLETILRARGIRGAVMVGLMKDNRPPPAFAGLWERIPVVVTGVRTRGPTLPFACSDHHTLVQEAFRQVLAAGKGRPALVIEGVIDRLVDGRFTAAFAHAQEVLPGRDRLPPFLEVDASRRDARGFERWLRRHRPDVILTLHTVVAEWVAAAGIRVPEELGLVQLERRRGCADWAGMEQHNDHTGEAAVDLLVSLLSVDGELPAHPRGTVISPSWCDGETL
jgi:LacI family transcriptional regulator